MSKRASHDWQAVAEDLAAALEAADDRGNNEWLGDDEATDWSLTGEERRRINAARARYHAARGSAD